MLVVSIQKRLLSSGSPGGGSHDPIRDRSGPTRDEVGGMSTAWQIVIDVARANGVYHGEPAFEQTIGGTHSANSWHYEKRHGGRAADCGHSDCDPAAVFRLFEPLARTGAVRELYYNPLGGYRGPGRGPLPLRLSGSRGRPAGGGHFLRTVGALPPGEPVVLDL
jgi:hypothetical protein